MKETVYMSACKPQFHGTFSNDKLGGKSQKIMAVSYVPGKDLVYFGDGRPVSDCKGTCSSVDCSQCGKRNVCYAIDSYVQYPAVTVNRVENTMQLREDIDKHFEDIKQAIIKNKIEILRYTESGEIENYQHFLKLVGLANDMPNVLVYAYTKNYEVLREYFNKGNELPKNLVMLISVWGDQGVREYEEFKPHENIKCFAVKSDIKVDAMCPAYRKDENGKVKRVHSDAVKCGNCGLCTGKHPSVKVIGCVEH